MAGWSSAPGCWGRAHELQEFAQLFKLVLSQYDVGTIPVSLDRVNAGEAARLGNREVKALFFLGADDGAVPQVAPAPGLFTDDDRSLLSSFGLELSPQLADKLDREMTIVYEACARPSHWLTVSWAAMDPQGEEKRPSFLVSRLRLLFPQNPLLRGQDMSGTFRLSAPGPAVELAGRYPQVRRILSGRAEYAPRVRRMEDALHAERGSLSPEAVQRLYGRHVPMSASRMDKYQSCHFSYFMQYGLNAKARRTAGFQAPEYGTFVHYVLEHVLQDPACRVGDGSGGWSYDRERARRLIREIMERYIAEELGGLENKTPRFLYLFQRLVRPVTQVVENVLDELGASQFRPIAFELGFGAKGELPPVELTVDGITVSISGFVDRLDGWVHNGRLYLRVVDYKTGRKSFDLTEVWNGLGLQMLLYLFTLEDQGSALYHREVTPAGVLYLPAREATVQGRRDMDEAERRKRADAELRRRVDPRRSRRWWKPWRAPERRAALPSPARVRPHGSHYRRRAGVGGTAGKAESPYAAYPAEIAQELSAGISRPTLLAGTGRTPAFIATMPLPATLRRGAAATG